MAYQPITNLCSQQTVGLGVTRCLVPTAQVPLNQLRPLEPFEEEKQMEMEMDEQEPTGDDSEV